MILHKYKLTFLFVNLPSELNPDIVKFSSNVSIIAYRIISITSNASDSVASTRNSNFALAYNNETLQNILYIVHICHTKDTKPQSVESWLLIVC